MGRYLSTQHFSAIIIEDRAAIRFIVPVELAVIVFWFLSSHSARLVALVTWATCGGLIKQYRALCGWLAAICSLSGWRADLPIIWLAFVGLFGVRVDYAFA